MCNYIKIIIFHYAFFYQFVEKDGYNGFSLEVLDWNEKAIQFYDKFGGVNRSIGEKGLQSLRFKHGVIAKLGTENK